MEIIQPSYYSQFRCLAGACPDSCCKEWDVDVDAASASRYRALPGPLGDRLRAVLEDREDGTVMLQSEGRCPMWRPDGLCQLQAELGEDALCQVCRDFPRISHDYGDFLELGLELSCPEAARLILTAPETPPVRAQVPGGERPTYDRAAMEVLRRTRREALALIQAAPPRNALAVLLLYGHAVQRELDSGEPAVLAPEALLAAARSIARPGGVKEIFSYYLQLEILTPQWRERLLHPAPVLSGQDILSPLAAYLIRRYWLQAIADGDLLCRVRFTVLSCLVVWLLGGDPVRTAQQYSKEIENDPENMETLLDGVGLLPALSDPALLGLLLS